MLPASGTPVCTLPSQPKQLLVHMHRGAWPLLKTNMEEDTQNGTTAVQQKMLDDIKSAPKCLNFQPGFNANLDGILSDMVIEGLEPAPNREADEATKCLKALIAFASQKRPRY